MCSCPKNEMESRFAQGRCSARAHLSQPTLGKLRGLVPKPSSTKLGGALQEADETQLWLELLREECGIECSLTTPIEQEANELMAIFTTIIRRTAAK